MDVDTSTPPPKPIRTVCTTKTEGTIVLRVTTLEPRVQKDVSTR